LEPEKTPAFFARRGRGGTLVQTVFVAEKKFGGKFAAGGAMKTKISVFTMLKNSDLAAMSALEATQQYLGYSALVSLKRLKVWELSFDSEQSQAVKDVETILNRSFYLMNPSKEKYALGQIPEAKLKPKEKLFRLKVVEKEPARRDHLVKKIVQKTAVRVADAQMHWIWELIAAEEKPESQVRAELERNVVVSSSRTKGLLINPVSQRFEWI
jgi:phosphoribosylformylglycinamidine (FGAM) synthase PurS component